MNKTSPYVYPGLNEKKSNIMNMKYIHKKVAEFHNMPPELILLKSRKREIIEPRQICMYLCVKYTNKTFSSIGEYFGKDHTTVMYSNKTICNLINTNRSFKEKLDQLEKLLIYSSNVITESKEVITKSKEVSEILKPDKKEYLPEIPKNNSLYSQILRERIKERRKAVLKIIKAAKR